MSRLNELVKELCPNGVEYKKLGDIEELGLIKLGRGNVISKTDIRECPGNYPIYSSSATGNGEFGRYGKYMFDYSQISWSIDGGGRFFLRKDDKYSLTNVSGWLRVLDDKVINIDYLYYVLTNEWQNKTFDYTHKAHPSVIRDEYIVPLPPLKIQQEIVKILDKFTELQAELQAELELRLKQYEHYRDDLLSFDKSNNLAGVVRRVRLGDIATIIRGGNFQKKDFVDEGRPCIHYGQIYTRYKTYADEVFSFVNDNVYQNSKKASKNDIIMAVTSENIEDVCKCVAWLGDEEVAVSGHTAIIKHRQNPKYLAYYFSSGSFFKQKERLAHGTKVIEVTPSSLCNITIPLPSLKVQERLVRVLDNFESICADLNIGLPAEIKLRQQQYEYYRDELLSFKLTNV